MNEYIRLLPAQFRSDEHNEYFTSLISVRWLMLETTGILTILLYKYVFVGLAGFAGKKYTPRVFADELFKQIIYMTALFVFGNYANNLNILTVGVIPLSCIVFGGLGEIPFLKNNLTNFFKNPRAIPVYISALLIILAFAGYNLWEAVTNGIIVYYIIGLLVCLGVVAAFIATGIVKKISIHPHHWVIFYMLALFTRFAGVIDDIAGGVCIGIYIQGIASFGSDSAFF